MKNEKNALKKLTNFDSRVSCHYFITYSGEIINLVPDLYISWHAGKSRWKKIKSLNKIQLELKFLIQDIIINIKNFKKKQIKSIIFFNF